MPKKSLLAKHIFISLLVLVLLLAFIFLSFNLFRYISENNDIYILGQSLSTDVSFISIIVFLVIVGFLSYIVFYLISTGRTRIAFAIENVEIKSAMAEKQFAELYNSAPIPYIILNNNGEIIRPNKSTLRFFGVVPEEIVGKDLFTFVLAEDKDKADRILQHYKLNMPIDREELRMFTKNGSVKWVLISVFEINAKKGDGRTGLATIFDISEQKQLDQTKTEFMSLATHQLRTPLATLKWYSDMLLSPNFGSLTDKQTEYVKTIYKVNQDMIDLVDTLLNVSRIEIGTLSVNLESTDVPLIAESILGELASQITNKKINIVKQYNDSLKNIKSDPKLLRIIIQNLMTNAVKYTPEGGTVTLTLIETANSKQISVADTGLGIPKNQQDKIFTKLFRADNVRDISSSQSTGLGLYLIKSLVKVLNGNISFESKENEGSTFTITL
ncbi:MAG: PAS domain-containing sensor histidine kinase [Candidatus Taylorbacteria bacterium]|nr:PAS domain-containing sensor histidine kinase [Candidatus Taylorbacteria bacterium]